MEVTPRPDIPGVEKLRLNEAREYRLQAKAIIEREGCWPDRDADVEIAIKMRSMGYPRDNISMGISQASPETVNMPTLAQSHDYGRSIVSQVEAMGYGPPKSGLHL